MQVYAFPVNKTARSVCGMFVCVYVHAIPAKKIARSVCGMCVCAFPVNRIARSVLWRVCVCVCAFSVNMPDLIHI